jgi:hypothetical protein
MGISGWTVEDSPEITPIHLKGGQIDDVQVLGLKVIDSVATPGGVLNLEFINNPITRHRIGILWSNIKTANLGFRLNAGAPDDFADIFSARNCWNVDYHPMVADSGTATFTRDVIDYDTVQGGDGIQDGGLITIVKTSLTSASSGLFDGTTNLLTGDARTANLGLRGCEATLQ